MDSYETDQRGGYDDEPQYERNRSRSPRADRDGDTRIRSASPRGDRGPPQEPRTEDDSPNTGSNLFVTGIHPRLSEQEVQRLFEKYGDVEQCSIMRDPHTRESRGFGFVKMVTSDQADAAKDALQGEVYEGRTLSIEKARRSKPRTPTPGKYFGPPKRDDRPPRRGFGGDRYDDRRSYRRDDYGSRGGGGGDYRGSRGGDRYEDRGYSRRDRDDYGSSRSYRDDRYGGGGREERRGGGYGGGSYDRAPRGGGDAAYGDAPAAAPPAAEGGRRGYDDDRYARR